MNKGKVYELNGEEQEILEEQAKILQAEAKLRFMKADAVDVLNAEIKMLNDHRVQIISYMADRFGLTRVQVINKVLVANSR